MSTTNFGNIPSNLPAPTPRCQIKRGVTDSAVNYNNTVASNTKIGDGAGGFMQISVTPTYACYWLVCANFMTHSLDGDWRRCDFSIYITPADAEGITQGCQIATQVYP